MRIQNLPIYKFEEAWSFGFNSLCKPCSNNEVQMILKYTDIKCAAKNGMHCIFCSCVFKKRPSFVLYV